MSTSTPTPRLFQLPSSWFVAFLSEWLDMPSIGKLDTAICSKKHRSQFLNYLQTMRSTIVDDLPADSPHLGFFRDQTQEFVKSWWRWLSVRQIYIENIFICGKDVRFDLAIPSMRKVVADLFEDHDLRYLVRNCPSLRSLSLATYPHVASHRKLVTGAGLKLLQNLRETLQEFSFNIDTSFQVPPYKSYYEGTAEALIDIFCQCPHLQKVSLTGEALFNVNLDQLCLFGNIFHELEIQKEDSRMSDRQKAIADGRAVSDLLISCANLKKLRYARFTGEQDYVVITPRSCPWLEDLELNWISIYGHADISNAPLLDMFCTHCTNLRRLKLEFCRQFSPSLRRIARLEGLKELTFYQCGGLQDADMDVVATIKLAKLSISAGAAGWTLAFLRSFVGSNMSQTLESFYLSVDGKSEPMDDVEAALALASCHSLRTLYLGWGWEERCVFGRNGLDGLQAMTTGCPLLADFSLYLTVPALHYLGTHFASLKKCLVLGRATTGFPSIEELQSLYPAVEWDYLFRPRLVLLTD
jgi:hypothetical protein